MVVTNVETGTAEYVPARLADWLEFMKASCAIPFFYRNFCRIENKLYVDGGVADPLPVEQAYREGARQIVVNSASKLVFYSSASGLAPLPELLMFKCRYDEPADS